MQHFLFDNHLEAIEPSYLPTNIRGVKYGEGCFETMLFKQSTIRLGDKHFFRLENSLKDLGIYISSSFTLGWLTEFLQKTLDNRNEWRIRLSIFNGEVNFEQSISKGYINIEVQHLYPPKQEITLGILHDVQPSLYPLKNHKSLSFQIYVYAIQYAKKINVDDVVLVNNDLQVIETSISNIFILKSGQLKTSSLSVGCVDGVMRSFVIQNVSVLETQISLEELDHADEIFLTNALGIRSVKEWNGKKLSQQTASILRDQLAEI